MTTGSRVRCTPRIQPLPASTSSTPGRPTPRSGTTTRPRAGWGRAAGEHARSAGRRTPRPATTMTRPMPAASQDACTPSPTARVGPAGAEPAGRPRGRAVLDERADDGQQRHQRRADAEPGQRSRAEMTDHGGVDEQVERLGREHDERPTAASASSRRGSGGGRCAQRHRARRCRVVNRPPTALTCSPSHWPATTPTLTSKRPSVTTLRAPLGGHPSPVAAISMRHAVARGRLDRDRGHGPATGRSRP